MGEVSFFNNLIDSRSKDQAQVLSDLAVNF
jgi:hypothetical protein